VNHRFKVRAKNFWMLLPRWLACRSEGAELLEFALALPFLAVLLMGIVDFGGAWCASSSRRVQRHYKSAMRRNPMLRSGIRDRRDRIPVQSGGGHLWSGSFKHGPGGRNIYLDIYVAQLREPVDDHSGAGCTRDDQRNECFVHAYHSELPLRLEFRPRVWTAGGLK
jgi:hypothetical protein